MNPNRSGVNFSDEGIEEQSKSSFFITQGFPKLSLRTPNTSTKVPNTTLNTFNFVTPKNVLGIGKNLNNTITNSPSITSYMNFIQSQQGANSSRDTLRDVSQISLNSKRRYDQLKSNPFAQFTGRKNSKTNHTSQRERSTSKNSMVSILNEVDKEIQIKDNIKYKARMKTLSNEDWQQVGQNRVLQFTVLDRIIEDCGDYQKQNN